MMRRLPGKKISPKTNRFLKWGAVCVAALCLGVLAASVVQIVSVQMERDAAKQEYDALRRRYAPDNSNPADGTENPVESGGNETEPPKAPAEVNPDYAGWLSVSGAGVDYPVVRGADNEKYLNTTFEGAANSAGSIFMDCGNADGFESRHTVLYGHSMRNGGMFGSLKKYLDAGYLSQNPGITVTMPDGEVITYHIFAARVTDAWDAAYRLDFTDDTAFADFAVGLGAPEGTANLLTLSTCTNGADDNERILVHAAR